MNSRYHFFLIYHRGMSKTDNIHAVTTTSQLGGIMECEIQETTFGQHSTAILLNAS